MIYVICDYHFITRASYKPLNYIISVQNMFF